MSLKATLPALERILCISQNALYERQKTLVQEGLLTAVKGRGPGSGVHANEDSIALLIIAACVGFGTSSTGSAARALAETKPTTGRCRLTGAETFSAALARILIDKAISERVAEIVIPVNWTHAFIRYDVERRTKAPSPGQRPAKEKSSVFLRIGAEKRDGLDVSVTLNADLIHQLNDVVTKLLNDEGASS